MGWPDYNQFVAGAWGWSEEVACYFGNGSNVVFGTNPPFYAADFLEIYPKFGGTPLTIIATATAGSAVLTVASTAGLETGQLVAKFAGFIPANTSVASVGSSTTFTLSQPVAASGTISVSIFVAPFVPIPVINAYVALASSALVQARWQDMWTMAMGLYVAHFLTLWLRSDGDEYSTPGRAAAAGLQRGIVTAQSAGPVSESLQVVTGLDDWAAWTLTTYGAQLATFMKSVGAGPMLLY